MAELIVSVSGIRGIVGDGLTPRTALEFALCYGTPRAGGTVVLSRDGRTHGVMLRDAVAAGLTAAGCHVLDIGVAATPTTGFYAKIRGAAGAVQVTASHNPPEWNGLKLFRPEGFVLGPAEGRAVADAFRTGACTLAEWDKIGRVETVADAHAPHLDRVLEGVDVEAIGRRRFHVVV
ncbi:MAG: phosphoglucosamine mutase, partial [Planctomycetia bacterium]